MDTETPVYNIVPIEGKGHGAVSTTNIKRGTRIVSESPLITVPRLSLPGGGHQALDSSITRQLQTLSKDDQRKFFGLHNNYVGKLSSPIKGIIKTNAMPLGANAIVGGVFPQCARFNHSCNSNATYTWNENIQQECIYAIRDIPANVEITVSYLSDTEVWLASPARRAHLLDAFGFECRCTDVCALPDDQRRVLDQRSETLGRLDGAVGDGRLIMDNPARALQHCKTLAESGLVDHRLSRAYYDAFQVCVTHSDFARAAVMARLAAEEKEVCAGPGAAEELRVYEKRPESHRLAGLSKKWRSQAKHRREPGSDGFQQWLWMRAG